ncbi:MAG: polyprenyl synthetase family protein [Phoenicibacter congonensis]|uniref:Polyprenyl synthetase family protein n=1 Tax=Phoenicibacter congonensis TaxID=1944646 RepID=A0AA43RHX3_9ACTN|nr:polyprenyl synthetase family protein [Phoenicibacter congonensis]
MINSNDLQAFSSRIKNEISECENFQAYVSNYCKDIAALSTQVLPKPSESLAESYLTNPLQSFFENPGKCSRSLCCLLANYAFSGKIADCITSALAIEVFQNAALIHDDIADNALTRRNKPCLHVTHGIGTALNAGDYALTFMDQLVLNDDQLQDATKMEVLLELSNMKTKTIEGQAIDIGWENAGGFGQNEEDYEKMATLKTANYTCASPMAIGAIIAGAPKDKVQQLREAGLKCGLAFQIQDDLLNVDRTTQDSSKDFALDIAEGKRTLIALHAIKSLDAENSKKLQDILDSNDNTPQEIEDALNLIEKSGALDYAKERTKSLIFESKSIMNVCMNEGKEKELLISMADWCLERTH